MISEAALLELVLSKQTVALFLDYDGTLAEFAPTPDHIEPDKELVELLRRLTLSPRVTPVILSGRSLRAIEALVPLEGMTLAGSYGVEIRFADGTRTERLRRDSIRPFLDSLAPVWRELVEAGDGFFLEDKRWSLAIHARFAQAGEAERVLSSARERAVAMGLPEDFRLLGEGRFLEVAPRSANKQDGVEYLLKQVADAGFPLYFGDDDKDLEAFDAIHQYGGLTVLVGGRYPEGTAKSDCRLPDPGAVRAWLNRLLDHL